MLRSSPLRLCLFGGALQLCHTRFDFFNLDRLGSVIQDAIRSPYSGRWGVVESSMTLPSVEPLR